MGALLTSIAIPTGIGLGATLQALAGAFLGRQLVGFPHAFIQARDVIAFLTTGGPVSCLISATVGVMTLSVSGKIPVKPFDLSEFSEAIQQIGRYWLGLNRSTQG